MIATMFMDDSKDSKQEVVVVSAGLVGSKDQWDLLRKWWNNRLRKDNLAYFKNSDCVNLQGEFYKFRELGPLSAGKAHAQLIREDLKLIIRSVGVVGAGVAIAIPDWNQLRELPGSYGFFARDPYETAFQSLMFESVKDLRRVPGRNMIRFFHDEGDDFERLHVAFKEFKNKNPKIAKYVGGFESLDDKVHAPLQAADLIANSARLMASEWVQTRKNISLSLLRECIPRVQVWDRTLLLELLERHKRKAKRRGDIP